MTAIFRLPNLMIFNDSFHGLGLAIRGIIYLLIFLIISAGNQPALSMGVDQSMIKQVQEEPIRLVCTIRVEEKEKYFLLLSQDILMMAMDHSPLAIHTKILMS